MVLDSRASMLNGMVMDQLTAARAADPDADLVPGLQRRDPDGLAAMYDRFGSRAYGLAMRILGDAALAQDAVQDTFLAVWRQSDRYQPARAPLRTWVLAIAYNRAIDVARRRRRNEEPTDELNTAALRSPDAALEALARIEAAGVRCALERISAPQRQALMLTYFGGFTQTELAASIGIPLGTAKSRVRLGLIALRRVMEAPVIPEANDRAAFLGGPLPASARVR